jgi:cytochrome d ubiquinol oxidase subunit II
MLLLAALIFRVVAIEFTGQDISARWRNAWEVGFSLGSVSVVLVFGVAVGNILRGIPLSASGDFAGTLVGLFNGYSLLIGAAGLAMVATHGALFAGMKTSGEIASRLRRWARISWGFYLALYIAAGVATVFANPELLANYRSVPALWILPGLTLAALVCIVVFNKLGAERKALGASAVSIVGVMATISAGLFPNLLPALGTPERNLTAYNASSSELTLTLMLPITLVGMALVVVYTLYVRKPFRGKLDQEDFY